MTSENDQYLISFGFSSVWGPLGSGHTALSEALTAFKSIYQAICVSLCLLICPSIGLCLSDRVWPHVSQSTTMSVGRNRQVAWQPAFLMGAQHWQLRPSRTTSNVTHCWHFLNTHSLNPIACSFVRTTLLLFYGEDSFIRRCVCVRVGSMFVLHMCIHREEYSFLHLLCICSYISRDMFKCHNRAMSTGSDIAEQDSGL